MKPRTYLLIAILCVLCIGIDLAHIQNQLQAQSSSNVWILKPQLITTSSAQDICTLTGGPPCGKDVQLCYADASTNGSSTTITMADKQTVPVVRPNAIPISANAWQVFPLNYLSRTETVCAWYPGGLTLTIGNANVLSVQMSGRY